MTSEDILVLKERVLDLLLAGDHAALRQLRDQRSNVVSESVEVTGKGFFVNFDLSPDAVALPEERNLQFMDVEASVKGVDYGFGFVLFVKEGFLSVLEGYTYEEDFSRALEVTELAYSHGAKERDMVKLEQMLSGNR